MPSTSVIHTTRKWGISTSAVYQVSSPVHVITYYAAPGVLLTKGGERKRVSLAEALSTDAAIYCWDNATRGLDAGTALDYTRVCRSLCDVQRKINVVSLYQAGNGIYNQFDKVTVIAEGRVIYYGPRAEARPYFESLGFEHMDGANTADYLTAVTALAERRVFDGWQGSVPNTAAEFAAIYRESNLARRMRQELEDHLKSTNAVAETTRQAQESTLIKKNKGVPKSWPMVTSLPLQVKAALIREYQQRWGDQWLVCFVHIELLLTSQVILGKTAFHIYPGLDHRIRILLDACQHRWSSECALTLHTDASSFEEVLFFLSWSVSDYRDCRVSMTNNSADHSRLLGYSGRF